MTPPEQLARLDLGRRERLGMLEAVWGENKDVDQITVILERLHQAGELALVTRVTAEKAAAIEEWLQRARPQIAADLGHHRQARCLTSGILPSADPALGLVHVLCGGTSDLPVAHEAQLALRCHGVRTELVVDVGVAGLHRLLDELPRLRGAQVLIACAGMEGALPTVLAGLLPQPVIGVPVSVGYGVSAGGAAALNGMLASCAPGLSVVNIDNGYGAAMAALRILLALRGAAAADRPSATPRC
ncbi:nickel pincer cofactor biosynthesis protein LarB [Synechococcus sp. Cruz-9H2]|uniref:nickel pincer cofactor biosynthesis protein LarB n=1 Tax=unclassified Synechococcus TaxID=2626047 RepID=UPI0020CDAE3A|nr:MULTISPECIES: nickel pincer cofactor biosynthesis protein LarB [unclassified Synechococcus]MCP9819233.1 nickel pincer cofactor biosynthesis protein LarB [Synechococcus sp. Cruz-9H2]MCP9843737.1 nickel pincer cofactor biosynthesis protein LarB [Synechococcus sp. Edmonson 11F2]MCP9855544.1 nickel pincer cofactor biosynthesis protein LarB [Synechococcus sp. Cruz-9C9]MCP9862982.1 nickel pincer cofactor biosynthesis protein LarB [Synechococcus sp. Cruz-7E5]MCP9870143.1 nickel pincer cofactor bio